MKKLIVLISFFIINTAHAVFWFPLTGQDSSDSKVTQFFSFAVGQEAGGDVVAGALWATASDGIYQQYTTGSNSWDWDTPKKLISLGATQAQGVLAANDIGSMVTAFNTGANNDLYGMISSLSSFDPNTQLMVIASTTSAFSQLVTRINDNDKALVLLNEAGAIKSVYFNGATWEAITTVSTTTSNNSNPVLDITNSDTAISAWITGGSVYVSLFSGGSWSTPEKIADNVVGTPQVVLNTSGRAVLAYQTTGKKVMASFYNGVTWADSIQVSSADVCGLSVKMASDHDDMIRIAWSAQGDGQLSTIQVRQGNFECLSASIPIRIVSTQNKKNIKPSLSMTNAGNVVLSWVNETDGLLDSSIFVKKEDQWFEVETISISPEQSGSFAQASSGGHMGIGYVASDGKAKIRFNALGINFLKSLTVQAKLDTVPGVNISRQKSVLIQLTPNALERDIPFKVSTVSKRYPTQVQQSNQITWSKDSTAQGYNVYKNGARVAQLNKNKLSFTDINIPAGGFVTYRVTALNEEQADFFNTVQWVQIPSARGYNILRFKGEATENIVSQSTGDQLNENELAPDITSFLDITVKPNQDFTYYLEVLTCTDLNLLEWNDRGLPSIVDYYVYRADAQGNPACRIDQPVYPGLTSQKRIYPDAEESILPNYIVTAVRQGQDDTRVDRFIKLSWVIDALPGNIEGFNVYRDGVRINNTLIPKAITEYLDATININLNHVYFITAQQDDGHEAILEPPVLIKPSVPACVTCVPECDECDILTKVCTIDSKVDAINELLITVDSKIDEIDISQETESKVCDIDSKIDITNELLQTVDSKIDEISIDPATESKVCDIDSKIDITNEILESVDSKIDLIDILSEEGESKICAIDSKIDITNEILESIESKVDEISIDPITESKVCDIDSKIDITNELLQTVDSKIDEIDISPATESKVCDIDSKIDITNELLQTVDSKIDEISIDPVTESKVCDIDSKIDITNEILESVDSKIDLIDILSEEGESKICAIDSKIDITNEILESIESKVDEISIDPATESKVCDIDSKIDITNEILETVDSKIDLITINPAVESKICVVDSKVDLIEENLESFFDILDSSIDSLRTLVEDCCGTGSSSSNNSFVQAITDGRQDFINVQFQYGIPAFSVETETVNGGVATTDESSAVLTTAGADGDEVRIESTRSVPSRPGHQGFGLFTAAFTNGGIASATQFIGLLDDADGFAVGYSGTLFGVLHRRDGSDTFVPQASFNVDKLDGSGPSGFAIDQTKMNLFIISYGLLAATPIVYRVFTSANEWVVFHVIESQNVTENGAVLNPALPIRAHIIDSGSGGTPELRTVSWNGGILGHANNASHQYYSTSYTQFINANQGEQPMLTIRNKSTFQTKVNKIEVRISGFGGGAISNSQHATFLRLVKNASLTGASFSDFCPGESVVEVDTSATAITGGKQILFEPVQAFGNGPGVNFFPGGSFEIRLLPGETMSILETNVQGETNAVATIAWEEQF